MFEGASAIGMTKMENGNRQQINVRVATVLLPLFWVPFSSSATLLFCSSWSMYGQWHRPVSKTMRTEFIFPMSVPRMFHPMPFFFQRAHFNLRYLDRFGHLNRALTHTLSFKCCLWVRFSWLNHWNLLDGCIK